MTIANVYITVLIVIAIAVAVIYLYMFLSYREQKNAMKEDMRLRKLIGQAMTARSLLDLLHVHKQLRDDQAIGALAPGFRKDAPYFLYYPAVLDAYSAYPNRKGDSVNFLETFKEDMKDSYDQAMMDYRDILVATINDWRIANSI